MAETTELRRDLDRIAGALHAISETQATQTALLEALVEAVTGESEEDPVLARLDAIAETLGRHERILARIEAARG